MAELSLWKAKSRDNEKKEKKFSSLSDKLFGNIKKIINLFEVKTLILNELINC
jgi:hypothetical protein